MIGSVQESFKDGLSTMQNSVATATTTYAGELQRQSQTFQTSFGGGKWFTLCTHRLVLTSLEVSIDITVPRERVLRAPIVSWPTYRPSYVTCNAVLLPARSMLKGSAAAWFRRRVEQS